MIQYSDRGKSKDKRFDLVYYRCVSIDFNDKSICWTFKLNSDNFTVLVFFFYNYYRTQMFKSELLLCFLCSARRFDECCNQWLPFFSVRTWFFTFHF